MSDLSDVVSITVSTQNPGVTQAGFGVPAIVSHSAAWAERSRSYGTLAEVADDFATSTVEYLAASQIFAQSPTVEEIKILRASGAPTQRYAIGVAPAAAPAPVVGAVYAAKIKTAGQDYQTATHTAAASAAWVALTAYTKGYLLLADTNKFYICITAGTSSGASPPTGTGSDITDGTVHWMYAGAGTLGAASNDAIVYNLKEAIDALASPAVSGGGATLVTTSLQGSAGAKTLRILANTAGQWWAVQITDPAVLTIAQDHANSLTGGTDATIQAALAAIALEDSDWYGLVTTFNSTALVQAAATWCETANKLYRVASLDSEIIQVVYASASDVAKTLAAASRRQTTVFYHPDASEFADAASFGRWFPIDPGGDDWRMKTLSGVTAQGITSTWKTNAEAKKAAYYYTLGGVSVVGGDAKVASGEYIDVIRGLAWYEARLGERIANLIIQNEKIPYTDAGAALIEAQVIAMNTEGIRKNLIRDNPAPTVSVPKVADVSSANRTARLLPDVNTTWELAGAIHKTTVSVAVTA